MRSLLVFLLINFNSLAQQPLYNDVLILGNYAKICMNDSSFSTADTLPDKLSNYKVVMLFSTSTSKLSEDDIERLTDFVEEGGGLYAGSDNWPLQSESRQVTQRLYKKESYGEFEQKNAQLASGNCNLQLEEMDSIPAGTTTVAFPMDYRLNVEAWIEDQPLILSGRLGKGRIIIDGGYSRFYCDVKVNESVVLLEKYLSYLRGN